VLRYRLAGASDRSGAARSTGRTINRGAARNMMLKDMKQREYVERASWRMRYTAVSSLRKSYGTCISKRQVAGICVAEILRSRGRTFEELAKVRDPFNIFIDSQKITRYSDVLSINCI
jgi:hypothetical protein